MKDGIGKGENAEQKEVQWAKKRKEIGVMIEKRKQEKGISYRQLAAEIGIKHPQIARIVRGDNYNVDTLIKVLNGLDLEISVTQTSGKSKSDNM